jgi:hypothetical protein
MHLVSGEMKAKKLKSLEEENELFPDTDKFNSSPINQKKKAQNRALVWKSSKISSIYY